MFTMDKNFQLITSAMLGFSSGKSTLFTSLDTLIYWWLIWLELFLSAFRRCRSHAVFYEPANAKKARLSIRFSRLFGHVYLFLFSREQMLPIGIFHKSKWFFISIFVWTPSSYIVTRIIRPSYKRLQFYTCHRQYQNAPSGYSEQVVIWTHSFWRNLKQ